MVLFDTLRASQRLQAAGFEAPKADAIVTAFAEDVGERVATKVDLAALRAEIAHTEERLRGEIAHTEERLRGEMHQMETRLIRWMVATALAGVGVAAAVATTITLLLA